MTDTTSGPEPLPLPANRAQALLTPATRELHRNVLRFFLAAGRAPAPWELLSLNSYSKERWTELVASDLVTLAEDGAVQAAYPFSGLESSHHVRLSTGITVYAACAIDALGIPRMIRGDAAIYSEDARTGQSIAIAFTRAGVTPRPPETAVVRASLSCDGSPADVVCPVINFFASFENADVWLHEHPEAQGEVMNLAHATRIGNQIFGCLLERRDSLSRPKEC